MTEAIRAATLAQYRMHSLLLGGKRLASVKDIAVWFGAMQSQDLASGKWSFGVRLPTAMEADIERAIERAEVLRTWPMRGTIHFVPAEDARWMLQTTGIKALKKAAARRAYLGLDEATVKRAADLLGKALAGGKRFTRDEAAALWKKKGIDCEGQRVYHMLWYASQIGITCIGPSRDKDQTYVLLDEWAKRPRQLCVDEALCTLATRYFRSHGPVSQQDFMGWSGLTSVEAKRAIAMAEPVLAAVPWNGKTLWMDRELRDAVGGGMNDLAPRNAERAAKVEAKGLAATPASMPAAKMRTKVAEKKANVKLTEAALSSASTSVAVALPGFDEFILGYKDRSLVIPAAHQRKIVPGNNGVFMPTLVLNGLVVGTWRREVKQALVRIQPQPFARLARATEKAFDAAFQHYAAYLGLKAVVEWT